MWDSEDIPDNLWSTGSRKSRKPNSKGKERERPYKYPADNYEGNGSLVAYKPAKADITQSRSEYPSQSSRSEYPSQSSWKSEYTNPSTVLDDYPSGYGTLSKANYSSQPNKTIITKFREKELLELYDEDYTDLRRVAIIEFLYDHYRTIIRSKPRKYRTLTKPEFALELAKEKYESYSDVLDFISELSDTPSPKSSEYDNVDYYINFLELFNKEIAYDLGLDEEMIEYELDDELDVVTVVDKRINASYNTISNILDVLTLENSQYNEFMTKIKTSLDGDGNISMTLEDLIRLSDMVGINNDQKELLKVMVSDISE